MRSTLLTLFVALFVTAGLAQATMKLRAEDDPMLQGKAEEEACDKIHSQEFELTMVPMMKGMADDALEAYAHAVAFDKYQGDEELRECVAEKVGDAVTEVLAKKWKFERGLRDSLYGIYLSAEAAGGLIAFGLKLKGAGFLVKVVTPQRRTVLRFIPVAELRLGLAASSHFSFPGWGDVAANVGLLFLADGERGRATITVSDFAKGLGENDGGPMLGIGGHVGLAGTEVAKLGETKGSSIIIAGWKGGLGIGAGIEHGIPRLIGKSTARHYAKDKDLGTITGKIEAAAEEAVQDQSKKLNFVAKLAAKIEVTKAYRDIEMFEEMCNE